MRESRDELGADAQGKEPRWQVMWSTTCNEVGDKGRVGVKRSTSVTPGAGAYRNELHCTTAAAKHRERCVCTELSWGKHVNDQL